MKIFRLPVIVGGAAILATASAVPMVAAIPEQVQQLRQTLSCRDCDLSDADLSGSNLPKADLAGANLSFANLYGADLRGADLTGAVLANANLSKANLAGAIGVSLGNATTDERTTCPSGAAGPCK